MKRVVRPELLDEDLGTPEEIAASLADLRRVNSWFGGVATTADMVSRIAQRTGESSFSLLEVGAGCGGMITAVQKALGRRGLQIVPTLLDRKASHLTSGPKGAPRVAGNALALPFRDASFDLVSSALLAHHLEPEELVTFVEEALRVCRVAVLINDLRRSALSLALVYAGLPLLRSRLSRHDGVASVRRAYTIREIKALTSGVRARSIQIRRHYLFRMGALLWKAEGEPPQGKQAAPGTERS